MPITTFTISGTALTGTVLTLSGQSSGSTTASGGAYSFGGLAAGNYTVTPSLSGYSFAPPSINVTVGPSDTTANFTGSIMPASSEALIARVQGSTLQNAFAQINPGNPQNLDLLQIVTPGDNPGANSPTVLINVDYTGAVHNPAVSPTNGTRVGVFQSPSISGGSTAQYFAAAFTNPQQQDILQVINLGGNISYYLNYQGVATGS